MRRNRTIRYAVALAAVFVLVLPAIIVWADGVPPKLFKIITAKDEIVVGLTDDELRSFGPAPDLDNLAQHLADAGQITVWQYAVKHGSDGGLVQAPLRRIAVFKSDTLRIEPYNPAPLKALPIESAGQ